VLISYALSLHSAEMRPIAVARSVVCVCVLGTRAICANTAEPIELPVRELTCVDPRNLQKAALLSYYPRSGRCTRPPRALGRHICPRRQANNEQCALIHGYVTIRHHMSPLSKVPLPVEGSGPHLRPCYIRSIYYGHLLLI